MRVLLVSLFIISILSMGSCVHDPISSIPQESESINLRWNQSYPHENINNAIIGLFWCLSHVGAQNTNPISSGIEANGNIIKLRISSLGFSSNAKESIQGLHQYITKSPEYVQNNSIDLGRYITLLIGASNHYYQITGVPNNLRQQMANYTLLSETGFVNNSSISAHHRTIRFSKQEDLSQLFISIEIDSVTKETLEFETMELMENGQFKYAIFDSDSQRISAAITDGSNAGKPAKCMWCHESNVNPMFRNQNDYTGFLTFNQLQDTLLYFRNELYSQQTFLTNGVDFSEKQAHTQMELQYIMFKQPSAMRLANEWKLSISEVEQLLANMPKNNYPEFSFLPYGYIRNDIEIFAPVKGLITPDNVREKSSFEVNYIN